jgi:prepilin-type N-terminal cleavage/methylation domain-containing protein
MPRMHRHGFTLVEILIVVVILAVLSVLIVPQMSSAATEATRAALRRQLVSIENNIEMYKTTNGGTLPTADAVDPMGPGGANDGWGVLVSGDYIMAPPINQYTGRSLLVEGDLTTAVETTSDSVNGWYMEQADTVLNIYAAGYNPSTDRLQHESVD